MLMFTVKILDDETVERLERLDDTVFSYRIKSLIVEELQKYNANLNRADIHVIETPVKKEKTNA